jgi:hypothetical protein
MALFRKIHLALAALFSLLALDAASEEMTFDIIYNNHTNIVVANGVITSETPARFQSFLDTEPFDGFVFLIHLNSLGGNLFGGIELGRMIRQQGLTTDVRSYERRPTGQDWYQPASNGQGQCYSACALAFLGGEIRELSDDATLGFHQFSGGTGNLEEMQIGTQLVSGEILDYMTSMGASPALFTRMSTALPNDMFIPNGEELLAYSIISKDAFTGFTLEPYREGVIASSVFSENTQGSNLVYQVTTYCRSEKLYILLSGRPEFSGLHSEFAISVGPVLDGFEIWRDGVDSESYSYSPNAVQFRSGQQLVEIQVNTRFLEMISKGRTRGAVQFPRVYGGSMAFDIEATPDDLTRISSSFRLCID